MKNPIFFTLFCFAALFQSAKADTGPYFVTYKNYCDVKKVYVTASNEVYGTEIGCQRNIGQALVGSIAPDRRVSVATGEADGVACLHTFLPTGTVEVACSSGGPIAHSNPTDFSVLQSTMGQSERSVKGVYGVSTDIPEDLERNQSLPSVASVKPCRLDDMCRVTFR